MASEVVAMCTRRKASWSVQMRISKGVFALPQQIDVGGSYKFVSEEVSTRFDQQQSAAAEFLDGGAAGGDDTTSRQPCCSAAITLAAEAFLNGTVACITADIGRG